MVRSNASGEFLRQANGVSGRGQKTELADSVFGFDMDPGSSPG